jgi:hypothetical protein
VADEGEEVPIHGGNDGHERGDDDVGIVVEALWDVGAAEGVRFGGYAVCEGGGMGNALGSPPNPGEVDGDDVAAVFGQQRGKRGEGGRIVKPAMKAEDLFVARGVPPRQSNDDAEVCCELNLRWFRH